MVELLLGSGEFIHVIREDPRIGWALAVLLAAGAVAAILMRRFRPAEFLKIPK